MVTQEDADLLGLSSLSGNHLGECRRVMEGLAGADLGDVAVVVGGTIPPGDVPALREMGVSAAFGTGTPLTAIVTEVARLLDGRVRVP